MNSLTRKIFTAGLVLATATPCLAWTSKTSSISSEEVTKVQQALRSKGDDPGPIDGIMGMKTRAAIKEFQSSNGLNATGTLDKQTKEKLGIEDSTTSSSSNK